VTDRQKLLAMIEVFAHDYEDKPRSTTILESGIKILWTEDGQIKSIVRNGRSYGPDGQR